MTPRMTNLACGATITLLMAGVITIIAGSIRTETSFLRGVEATQKNIEAQLAGQDLANSASMIFEQTGNCVHQVQVYQLIDLDLVAAKKLGAVAQRDCFLQRVSAYQGLGQPGGLTQLAAAARAIDP